MSSAREIALSVKVRDAASRSARAEEIRRFLSSLFERQSRVDLRFVAEAGFEDAVSELSEYDGIDPGIAAQIALHVAPEDGIQTSATLLRVARRLGVVDKRATPAKARTVLGGIVGDGDSHRLHRALILLGHTVCLPKSTRCEECFVGSACPSCKSEPSASKAKSKAKAKKKPARAAKAGSPAAKAVAKAGGKKKPAAKKVSSATRSKSSTATATKGRTAKKSAAAPARKGAAERNGATKKAKAGTTSRTSKPAPKSSSRKKK